MGSRPSLEPRAWVVRAQDWWRTFTFGVFSYDMARTQSIMRVATTASPVSGAEVREQVAAVERVKAQLRAARVLQNCIRWRNRVRKSPSDSATWKRLQGSSNLIRTSLEMTKLIDATSVVKSLQD